MKRPTSTCLTLILLALMVSDPLGAAPTVEQALQFRPLQGEVDYDIPGAEERAKCVIAAETVNGWPGWIVRSAEGQLLRRFLDTNKDNKVDQWCYFKDGVEVYRDIDANFNGTADQFRWLGTAGTRWGIDVNEDGKLDSWRIISPEEVSMELVQALANADTSRFARLLLTVEELKALDLGDKQRQELQQKIAAAGQGFAELARRQSTVTRESKWVHFGGSSPGIMPAGTDGSKRDVFVYDNVAVVVETAGQHSQVVLGSLVRAADAWRMIDLPVNMVDAQSASAPGGFFFQASLARTDTSVAPVQSGLSAEVQKLLADLEVVDKELSAAAAADQQARLNARRADLLQELAEKAATPDERNTWLRQLTDTVSAAVQSGGYPDGVARLQQLSDQLQADESAQSLVAYVKFRFLSAEYMKSLEKPDADYAKIQEKWRADLQAFVDEYPDSSDVAEAMLQLAFVHEFAGNEEEAVKWYGQIVSKFPSHEMVKKAAGAKRRLESVGKTVPLQGNTMDGKRFDLAAYRGRTVLLHYWATWCEPCKQDNEQIKQLLAKYLKQGFVPIGINLDTDTQTLTAYLKTARLTWPQLREPAGLDGRLANELGIFTLPAMMLIDKEGRVVNRSISAAELDTELGKLLR